MQHPCCADEILDAKDQSMDYLLDLPGVAGVGIAHRHPEHAICMYTHHAGVQVPSFIAGVPTVKKVTGEIRHLALTQSKYEVVRPLAQYPIQRPLDALSRPVLGGNSVGAYSKLLDQYVTGTIGMAFRNSAGLYVLGCDHVLAGISTVQHGGAIAGAGLFSPGPYFGGDPSQVIAQLSRWGDLDEVKDNELDWAAGLVSDPSNISPEIMGIGAPDSMADPLVGMGVQKMGALSGLTSGRVIDTDATIQVNYEDLFTGTFADQVVIDNSSYSFAEPGDSGSVMVANVGGHIVACGLVFSGSANVAVANKLSNLQKQIDLSLPLATLEPSSITQPGVALDNSSLALATVAGLAAFALGFRVLY